MARTAQARSIYVSDKVTTTPERLITMLYDRLVRDLVGAEQAIVDGNRETANSDIVHAQDIVAELLGSLNFEAWDGSGNLASLYVWILQELLHANVRQDPAKVAHCRSLVEPLAEAWHQAAGAVANRVISGSAAPAGSLLGAAV